MAEFIIHAGLHKTGTTTIQRGLERNRKALLRQGFQHPKFVIGRHIFANHSTPLFTLYCEDPASYRQIVTRGIRPAEALATFRRDFDALLTKPQAERVLISGEAISGLHEPGLAALRRDIERAGHAVRFIVAIRSPFEYLCSHLAQQVRGGEVLEEIAQPISIGASVERMRRVFPEAEFYPFAAMRAHAGGPAGFFLERIGADAAGFQFPEAANASGCDQAVRLVSAINARLPMFRGKVSEKNFNPARRRGDILPLLTLPGAGYRVTQSEYERYRSLVEREVAYLSETFGPDFCGEKAAPIAEPPAWGEDQLTALRAVLPQLPRHIAFQAHACLLEAGALDPAGLDTAFYRPWGDDPAAAGDEAAPSALRSLMDRAAARLKR